jgi:hypothetical protein
MAFGDQPPDLPRPVSRRDVLMDRLEAREIGLRAQKVGGRSFRPRLKSGLSLSGLGAFFIIIFASIAVGTVLGYGCAILLELGRIHMPLLVPIPIHPAVRLYLVFLGAALGMWVGCTRIAPAVTHGRGRQGRYR